MQNSITGPAIYARVSTTQQRDGTSLGTQVAACQQIAERDGQSVMPDLVFKEQASGADTDRRMLTELRQLIREGKVTRIYVYSPDRLCRSPFDLMTLTEEFSAAGTQLTFVQGPSGNTFRGQARSLHPWLRWRERTGANCGKNHTGQVGDGQARPNAHWHRQRSLRIHISKRSQTPRCIRS